MTSNSEDILKIENIEVMYDSVISALHDVSLSVPRGKIVALLGGNGAGKSTTLKAISTMLASERGKVTKGKIDLKSRACPFCSFKADLNEEYCPNCGDNLKFNCPHCHTMKFIITKFCKQCGKDISELSHYFINKDYAGIANLSASIAGDNILNATEIAFLISYPIVEVIFSRSEVLSILVI